MNAPISIANMPKKPAAPSTSEARILSTAIESARITKAAIAEHLRVTPATVSQWASGHRPVPADKAARLGMLVNAQPETLSRAYRELSESNAGNVVPVRQSTEVDQRDPALVIARLENDIHALNLAVGALTAVMVAHRPAEASDAAAALRRRVPAKFRDRGLVHELIELLDKAGARP